MLLMSLKNNTGSAMIITLIVVVVISLLGTALWQYGINSTIQVQKEVEKKQADYIARSGAEAVATYIIDSADTLSIRSYIDSVEGKLSEPVTLGNGSFQIKTSRNNSKITVESIGTVSDMKSTYSIILNEDINNGFPPLIFSNVMFSDSEITLNGNVTVVGSIECTGSVTVNGNSDPQYIENSTKNYPQVIYPDNTSSTELIINNNETQTISSDANYANIRVKNGGTLSFEMPGHDMTVIIDTLDVDGSLTISGTGRLYLYTKNFTGGGEVNVDTTSISSFLVLMPPTGTYDVTRFKGLLYGPGADVTLNGGPTFTGAMIVGEIHNMGNPQIAYSTDAQSISPDDFDGVELTTTTSVEYVMDKWN